MSDCRTNLYAFIIYPGDSAPENYMNIIESWHIPAAVSPVHDPVDHFDSSVIVQGEGKLHRHVMLYFGMGQKKSSDQVMEYVKQVNGTRCIPVSSRSGMLRYFIHFDSPHKQQGITNEKGELIRRWTEEDITLFAGFELGDSFGSFEKDEAYFKFIEDLIIKNTIVNTADLVLYLKDYNLFSELSFVRRHTYYFQSLIDGMYKRLKRQKEKEESINNN